MTVFDTWESYLYPPPDDKTLRNLVGIRDPQALEQYEYRETRKRGEQLKADPSLIEHTYDANHVRAIHRYLFRMCMSGLGITAHRTCSRVGGLSHSQT